MPALCCGHPRLQGRATSKDVDGRDEPGHDDVDGSPPTAVGMRPHPEGASRSEGVSKDEAVEMALVDWITARKPHHRVGGARRPTRINRCLFRERPEVRWRDIARYSRI
jgi:hypothetical protein